MNEENKQAPESNIAGGPMAPDQNTPVDVVDVQFRAGSKIYYFDPDGLTVTPGDHVIIETARGPEYGTCTGGNHQVPFRDIVPPLRRVIRLATEADERILVNNRAKEKRAFDICQQKIQEHQLDMQLVSAEYAFDGSKILFFFTADDRVDFRELVKNLAGIFRTRIELRQIGVRDKAKMVGGLGICGRPFCCAQFLDDFQPVSIKMAKTQNLSLNPTKISGTCGRLMCCLKYEHEAYAELQKITPRQGSVVDTPEGRGKVITTQMLRGICKVQLDDSPEHSLTEFRCEDCTVVKGACRNRQNAAAMAEERRQREENGETLPPERPAKPQRAERPARSERAPRSERPERQPKGERPPRPEKPERPARGERQPRPEKPERIEKNANPAETGENAAAEPREGAPRRRSRGGRRHRRPQNGENAPAPQNSAE